MKTPKVDLLIPEIRFQVQRSRGPGGQNVNRTNSSVQLRWSFKDSGVLSEEQKARIEEKLKNWLNKEAELLIRSDTHRDQDMNRKEVLSRLQGLLEQAFFTPKKRKATKPTYSSKVKRAKSKKIQSERKKNRQKVL